MTQQPDPADALPSLKVPEPEVNPKSPWGDDKLDRKEIAERLTSIVRGQEAPFVISIDGRWGTGKTFLLKRWRQDLENQGWQAIYYNAWEDDFAGDPLLSITGRLSEHLGGDGFSDKVRGALGRLVRPAYFAGSIVSTATIGMSLPGLPSEDATDTDHLGGYHQMRAAKDELKQSLEELAAEVRSETGQPLVFIIDELDRCRPTFAIELLERVKHIFDVPNIVFVLGINREQLMKSLQSVYGEIDADEYLRRFFDMEFALTDADPVAFCHHLFERFGLNEFFSGLMKAEGNNSHGIELDVISRYLPVIASNVNLSLRDIDYCVRVLALSARDLPVGGTLQPALLVVLVALKVGNRDLYRRFVERAARGAEVVDFIREPALPRMERHSYLASDGRRVVDHASAAAYSADDAEIVRTQLEYLRQGVPLDRPEYLADEHASLGSGDSERLQRIAGMVGTYGAELAWHRTSLDEIAKKIDLYHGMTRR